MVQIRQGSHKTSYKSQAGVAQSGQSNGFQTRVSDVRIVSPVQNKMDSMKKCKHAVQPETEYVCPDCKINNPNSMEEKKTIVRMIFSAEALDDGSYTLQGPFGEDNRQIKTHVKSRDEVTELVQQKTHQILTQLQ